MAVPAIMLPAVTRARVPLVSSVSDARQSSIHVARRPAPTVVLAATLPRASRAPALRVSLARTARPCSTPARPLPARCVCFCFTFFFYHLHSLFTSGPGTHWLFSVSLVQNGGSCSSAASGFTCACPQGFFGSTCQTLFNSCTSSPCTNGGSCNNFASGFTCSCPSGFYGSTCQLNACLSTPCQVCCIAFFSRPSASVCLYRLFAFSCFSERRYLRRLWCIRLHLLVPPWILWHKLPDPVQLVHLVALLQRWIL